MKKFCVLVLAAISIYSCGWKHLHKSVDIIETDRSFLDVELCAQSGFNDTTVVICASSASALKYELTRGEGKVKGIFMFSAGCHGFYSTFLNNKAGFDSISDLNFEVLFNDNFKGIPAAKRNIRKSSVSGKFYIADESLYGNFVDERVKFKRMIEELEMTPADIRISIKGERPEDYLEKFEPRYSYLVGTLFYLMDESGKTISLTYNLSPDDVKSILAKMN